MKRVGEQLFLFSLQVQVYIQVQEVSKHSMAVSGLHGWPKLVLVLVPPRLCRRYPLDVERRFTFRFPSSHPMDISNQNLKKIVVCMCDISMQGIRETPKISPKNILNARKL